MMISVIVATYNPDAGALKRTLDSIVCQKGVDWEVILTDDGSQQKDFSWLPAYFDNHRIQNYRLLENPENMGTIRNLLQGVQAAEGKYVYTTSPGDFLFDEFVLRDFYAFAEQKNCSLCFGNAVYYSAEDGAPKLTNEGKSVPRNPEVYNRGRILGKMNFFLGDWICGVSYFHKRENWIGYLQQAAEICRYAEDASTTTLALGNGERIWYYDRHIAWYEDGTGISTGNSSKWKDILKKEYQAIFMKTLELHPADRLTQIAALKYAGISQNTTKIKMIMKHPLIVIAKVLLLPKRKQKYLVVSQTDLERLQKLLSGEMA